MIAGRLVVHVTARGELTLRVEKLRKGRKAMSGKRRKAQTRDQRTR